jgi:hypothetical protein
MLKTVRKYSALALVAVMLTACGTSDVVTQTKVIENQTLDPNLPSSMKLQNVEWGTIEDPNAKDGSHLFTLTVPEFNKLSGNIVEMQRYTRQLKETVKYYKNRSTTTTKK